MPLRKITIIGLLILIPFLITGCASNRVSSSAGGNDNVQAMEDMGLSLVRQGDLRAGLEQLLKAVELEPKNPDLHHELALVYRDLEEYDYSLQHFNRALNLKPEFPEASNNLGTLYLLMGEWDSAIESFQAAVDDLLYKTPHIAYKNMGFAYYNKGEYEKAIESYLMALKEFPNYASCHVNLGIAYEALNRTDEAIDA
jgi:Tfp pilus assembly protein PilF